MFSARGLQLIQDLTGIEFPSARRTQHAGSTRYIEIHFPHSRWIQVTVDNHRPAAVLECSVETGSDLTFDLDLGDEAHGISPPDLDVDKWQEPEPLDIPARRRRLQIAY